MDDYHFTDLEWAEIRLLPSALCWLIAAADGRFDAEELRQLARPSLGASTGSALLARISSHDHDGTGVRIPASWGHEELEVYFERVRRTLGHHLGERDYDAMASALWNACWQVAAVEGITTDEAVVLEQVRSYLWSDR